jgi:CDP-paratose 2-epimerase
MRYVLITGSCGLVGAEAVRFFHEKNFKVIGVDNNFRKEFFGSSASVLWSRDYLKKNFKNYHHNNIDITKINSLEKIFKKYKEKIKCIIHCAAQPSHDWALRNISLDFRVNAIGTLNTLELAKKFCPKTVFIQLSTNKVYGDTPNKITLKELGTRFDVLKKSKYFNGISDKMTIDNSVHSFFGVSKCSADLITQEFGKNIGMKTVVFRLGCITGPGHSGAELHGFLSYLIKCNIMKKKYKVFGYKGKQVRDNIHSHDLVSAIWEFYKKPKKGEIYNLGGGRQNSCSIIEAMRDIEKISKIKFNYVVKKKNRTGDHQWYITDNSKFKKHFKNWKLKYNIQKIYKEMIEAEKLKFYDNK